MTMTVRSIVRILACAAALIGSGPAAAEANKPVTITNDATQPVPVAPQGTAKVAGTVTVDNGPSNPVPVQGTVTVGQVPPVSLAAGSSVTISNGDAAAVPVRDVDNPERNGVVVA